MIGKKSPPKARIVSEGAGRFRVEGEVDFNSVMHLLHQSRILFRHEERIRLDFSGVEKVNSAGLALLIEWMKETRRESRIMEISNLPGDFLAMARICDTQSLIKTVLLQDEQMSEE